MPQLKKGLLAGALLIGISATAASADVFNDATGENFIGDGHMDIASVEVTNTPTDITFAITFGNLSADWGKYLFGISTNPATGDTGSPVGNPWGRNIRMEDGMDAFVGSWVDSGGGFQPWTFDGAWTQNGDGVVSINGSTVSFTTSLASLGLEDGGSILFDVYTTGGGGGDSAVDAAANPSQTVNDWQVPYTTAAGTGLSYFVAIPEPGSVALLGLGGLALLRRRRA